MQVDQNVTCSLQIGTWSTFADYAAGLQIQVYQMGLLLGLGVQGLMAPGSTKLCLLKDSRKKETYVLLEICKNMVSIPNQSLQCSVNTKKQAISSSSSKSRAVAAAQYGAEWVCCSQTGLSTMEFSLPGECAAGDIDTPIKILIDIPINMLVGVLQATRSIRLPGWRATASLAVSTPQTQPCGCCPRRTGSPRVASLPRVRG